MSAKVTRALCWTSARPANLAGPQKVATAVAAVAAVLQQQQAGNPQGNHIEISAALISALQTLSNALQEEQSTLPPAATTSEPTAAMASAPPSVAASTLSTSLDPLSSSTPADVTPDLTTFPTTQTFTAAGVSVRSIFILSSDPDDMRVVRALCGDDANQTPLTVTRNNVQTTVLQHPLTDPNQHLRGNLNSLTHSLNVVIVFSDLPEPSNSHARDSIRV
jgi:hypothetical protein